MFSVYTNASLFIAMTDSTLLRRIFREDPLDNFYIHGFLFEFAGADDDIFYYDISCDDFRIFVFLREIPLLILTPVLIYTLFDLSG